MLKFAVFSDPSTYIIVRASVIFGSIDVDPVVTRSVEKRRLRMQDNAPDADAEEYVTTIPKAGKKYFGIGRSASYEAARRGEIPTIKMGRKRLVPVVAIKRKLAEA